MCLQNRGTALVPNHRMYLAYHASYAQSFDFSNSTAAAARSVHAFCRFGKCSLF